MSAKKAKTESDGFTAEERAAMKARAAELRAAGKKGAKKADGLQAVLDSIAEMAPEDRALADAVKANAVKANAVKANAVKATPSRPRRQGGEALDLPDFMSAEMKLSTRASGVPQLFIHDTVTRSSSCL